MSFKSMARGALFVSCAFAMCGATCGELDGGSTPGSKKATGGSCTPSSAGGQACEGGACLALNANQQGQSGICSQSCTGSECGAQGVCLDVGSGAGGCFQLCQFQTDCRDGFVCIALGDRTTRGICFVTTSGTDTDGGVVADGAGTSVTAIDGDGNIYQSVLIGTQRWMTTNLSTTRYRDGTAIPEISDGTTWRLLTTDARCDYENVASNSAMYGRLYNWYAVNTGKLCPMGWHVPSDGEWTTLENFLGEASTAGGRLKEIGTTHWSSPNVAATNDTGFTGLPGGSRFSTGSYNNITYDGYWWSTTTGSDPSYGKYLRLDFNSGFVLPSQDEKTIGLSVRCLKD